MSARTRPDGMAQNRLASFQHLNLSHNWLRQPKPRIVLGAVTVCFCFVLFKTISSGGGAHRPYEWTLRTGSTSSSQEAVELDPSFYVNGSPTSSFRDNLKPGVKYVTTWNYGGLTNELITWINLVHLAYISRRIPVLPPLLPDEEHLGKGGASLDASDIYDIPRLAKTLNLPILEWSQLKRARYYKSYIQADQESHDDDEVLGCWGIYETASEHHEALMGLTPHFLHLNVQYTAALSNFSSLANILSPSGRVAALSNSPPTWAEESVSPAPEPDDQLACFESLHPVPEDGGAEWEKDFSPAWDLIGTNMHFTRRIDLVVDSALRLIFDLNRFEVIPPFISVHIRRGDPEYFCGSTSRSKGCLPPLSAYAKHVREIQDELRRTHGQGSVFGNVVEVIVTSDEKDPDWWDEVEEMGWKETKSLHQGLQMSHGVWFPPAIDSAIHSRGAGFVGTSNSMMSIIAAKRVLDWQGGPSRMVDRETSRTDDN